MTPVQEGFLTVGEIVEAVGGTLVSGERGTPFSGVSTDSRNIEAGELFVALKGERFDAHDFFPQALARRAGGLMGRRGSFHSPPLGWGGLTALMEVDDPLHSLGEIARHWRTRHPVPLLAITGSNGKTTTKEMAAGILSMGKAVLKTEGNLNNRIGLPLTLLRLKSHHEAAVLEMGMNEPGEIRRLCEIAQPDFGLITQVSPSHLQGLGSMEAVARAKGELFDALGPSQTAIVNLDDPWVMRLARGCRARQVGFGRNSDAPVRAVEWEPYRPSGASMVLKIDGIERTVQLQCHGEPFLQNAMAAAAATWAMGATVDQVVDGLEAAVPYPMRLVLIPLGRGVHVLDDTYNANPASTLAAMETLCHLATGRRVAVLGDMLELGAQATDAHRHLGELAAQLGVNVLISVGEFADELALGARDSESPPDEVYAVASVSQALDLILGICSWGDWILVKGSRAMGLERVVEGLRQALGEVQKEMHAANHEVQNANCKLQIAE